MERRLLNKQFFFSKDDIFFGFHQKDYSPYNFLILHMKYYIYVCSRNNSQLDDEIFLYKFKFAINVLQYCKNRKLYNDVQKTFVLD